MASYNSRHRTMPQYRYFVHTDIIFDKYGGYSGLETPLDLAWNSYEFTKRLPNLVTSYSHFSIIFLKLDSLLFRDRRDLNTTIGPQLVIAFYYWLLFFCIPSIEFVPLHCKGKASIFMIFYKHSHCAYI